MTLEQMQQFGAEFDGRIAAAQAESAASFQAAAQANGDHISKAVEGKFATVDENFGALTNRVMELFGEQEERMDVGCQQPRRSTTYLWGSVERSCSTS